MKIVTRAVAAAASTLVAALVVLVPITSPAAVAASASDFDAGLIISDQTFFDSAAMSQAEVQDFLNRLVPVCGASAGAPTCLKSYAQATPTVAAETYCRAYSGSGSESAAMIIWKVAQSCGINPQVLIVTLQKEQGLVTSSAPTWDMYRSAMGFACPDSAPCDSQYYGFFNQVYSAARQFWRYINPSNNFRYQAGRFNTIQYSPTAACGSSSVYIKSKATAALYNYTPYQPNSAALANLYGSGDGCSAYGNRNFFRYFTDWFGSGGNLLSGASFENSMRGWGASNGFINQALYNDPSTAEEGSWFLAFNGPVAGRAMTQDVPRHVKPGEEYTATIHVRSGADGAVPGTLVLWGLGNTGTETSQMAFTAQPGGWTTVTVAYDPSSIHSLVRLDIYLGAANSTLWVDDASLTVGQAPVSRNLIDAPSFEGSIGSWVPGNGPLNREIYHDSSVAENGSWFAATNTTVAGRSLSQTFGVAAAPYSRYDFSLWVRSSDATTPVTGTLALWGLGGATSNGATTFTAAGQWTQIQVSVDVGSSGATSLKAELYLQTTGATYFVDNAVLAGNVLTAGSFEGPSSLNWVRDNQAGNFEVYPADSTIPAPEGTSYAATNAPNSSSSIYQDVRILPRSGQTYQAEAWVRSASNQTVSGTFALWALGGASSEVAAQDFTAGPSWTLVKLSLPLNQSGHTSFRTQIYLKTANSTYFLDGVQTY